MTDKEYCCECDEEIEFDPINRLSVLGDEIGPLCAACYRELVADGIIVEDE
jgi:hypothetical protein